MSTSESYQSQQCIPYRKELRDLAGSINSALIFQQLEYWFTWSPTGFYKFLSQPKKFHPKYRTNDSWTEELNFSQKEFRNAFDLIGVRHLSRTEYENQDNPFLKDGKELYFCSYCDKTTHVTYYFRNHNFTDKALEDLALKQLQTPLKTVPLHGVPDGQFPRSPKAPSTIYTEKTPEKTTTTRKSPRTEPIHSTDIIVPLDNTAAAEEEIDSNFNFRDNGLNSDIPDNDDISIVDTVPTEINKTEITITPAADSTLINSPQVFDNSAETKMPDNDEITGEIVPRDHEDFSCLDLDEISPAQRILRTIVLAKQYQVLKVLQDAIKNKTIKNRMGYLRSLVLSVQSGNFTPLKPIAKKRKPIPIKPSREATDLPYFLEQQKIMNGGVDPLAAYGGLEAVLADTKAFNEQRRAQRTAKKSNGQPA